MGVDLKEKGVNVFGLSIMEARPAWFSPSDYIGKAEIDHLSSIEEILKNSAGLYVQLLAFKKILGLDHDDLSPTLVNKIQARTNELSADAIELVGYASYVLGKGANPFGLKIEAAKRVMKGVRSVPLAARNYNLYLALNLLFPHKDNFKPTRTEIEYLNNNAADFDNEEAAPYSAIVKLISPDSHHPLTPGNWNLLTKRLEKYKNEEDWVSFFELMANMVVLRAKDAYFSNGELVLVNDETEQPTIPVLPHERSF